MVSPNNAETVVLGWTALLGTIIFCASYLWHRVKQAFPELFKQKNTDKDNGK